MIGAPRDDGTVGVDGQSTNGKRRRGRDTELSKGNGAALPGFLLKPLIRIRGIRLSEYEIVG